MTPAAASSEYVEPTSAALKAVLTGHDALTLLAFNVTSVADMLPCPSAYLPLAHIEHTLDPANEYSPGEQSLQTEALLPPLPVWKVPAAQRAQLSLLD